jgi:hypothetical protein
MKYYSKLQIKENYNLRMSKNNYVQELEKRVSELESINTHLVAELAAIKAEDYELTNEIIECKDAEIKYLQSCIEILQKQSYDDYEKQSLQKIDKLEKSAIINGHRYEKIYIEPIFDTSSMSIHNNFHDEYNDYTPIDIDIDSEVEGIYDDCDDNSSTTAVSDSLEVVPVNFDIDEKLL